MIIPQSILFWSNTGLSGKELEGSMFKNKVTFEAEIAA